MTKYTGDVTLCLEASFPFATGRTQVDAELRMRPDGTHTETRSAFFETPPKKVDVQINASVEEISMIWDAYGPVDFQSVTIRDPANCWLRVCAGLQRHAGAFASLFEQNWKMDRVTKRRLNFGLQDVAALQAVLDECPVCLDKKWLTRVLACDHAYCQMCAEKLSARSFRSIRCPKCRGENGGWKVAGVDQTWMAYIGELEKEMVDAVVFVGHKVSFSEVRASIKGRLTFEIVFVDQDYIFKKRVNGCRAIVVALDDFGAMAARACEWVFNVVRVDQLVATHI